MSSRLVHQDYVLDQARELIEEVGLLADQDERSLRSASEVLRVLHSGAKEQALAGDLRGLLRAEAQMLAGRLEIADISLAQLVEDETVSDRIKGLALDRRGDLSWWRGAFREAAELYRRSLEIRPDDSRTRKDLARALWHLGEPQASEEVFGGDVQGRVIAPQESIVATVLNDDVAEIFGLYVTGGGAGVMPLQGCTETAPGLVTTGSLGTMAQEACDLAWSIWCRKPEFSGKGARVHAPQAGVLKEGPSLGLAVYVLYGVILGRYTPTPGDAFSGELDLRGRVLPVGGIQDKALAAYLCGIRRLFFPKANLEEVEAGFSDILELRPIEHIDELEEVL